MKIYENRLKQREKCKKIEIDGSGWIWMKMDRHV